MPLSATISASRNSSSRKDIVMRIVTFACAVILGAVLMAFEMIASRYLTPYFGSGIITWAALISVVLLSMMLGYFAGGLLVDRYPTLRLAASFAGLAGLWFLLVPSVSTNFLETIMLRFDSEVTGVLVASCVLLLVPVTALGTYSPIAVRLMLRNIKTSGTTAGMIYGVSTLGNIIGTLGTALLIIPSMGSKSATYLLGAVTICCALVLFLSPQESER